MVSLTEEAELLHIQYQGEEWVQCGSILEGGMDGDVSLDLSNDGTVMVIGATREERSGHSRSAGKAAVFAIKDDGTEWILRQDLFGDTKGSNDGTSVAISADGECILSLISFPSTELNLLLTKYVNSLQHFRERAGCRRAFLYCID